jgi:hypothetical protein
MEKRSGISSEILLFEQGSLRESQVGAPPFLDQALGVRSRCALK